MRCARLSTALALALALPAHAERTPLPTAPWDLTGADTYSDICRNAETANVYGLRVFVRPPGAEPRIVMQSARIEFQTPVAARARMAGGRLAFTVKGPTPATAYRGEIADGYAAVRSRAEAARTVRLALRDDAHGLPDCD